MRAVVQRVKNGCVSVDGKMRGAIGPGLVVLIGISREDEESDVDYIAHKIIGLRIFEDDKGRMNLSVSDTGGEILLISQFTLYGDCRRGRRPSFTGAAEPAKAQRLYEFLVKRFREKGLPVATGVFQANMLVEIKNYGPVTLLLDSKKEF